MHCYDIRIVATNHNCSIYLSEVIAPAGGVMDHPARKIPREVSRENRRVINRFYLLTKLDVPVFYNNLRGGSRKQSRLGKLGTTLASVRLCPQIRREGIRREEPKELVVLTVLCCCLK